MRNKMGYTVLAPCVCAAAVVFGQTQNTNAPAGTSDAAAIIEKSQKAFYAAGADMKADVNMELIAADGKKRARVMTMLRLNAPGGADQKYFVYFKEPADVRRMTFLVWKYPEKEDDRWIYIPAVDLVRRVASDDKRSSFVGSDFTYEDISGRDVSADSHTLLREEKLGENDCYALQSIPTGGADYTKRISWVGKENFLPLKEEYYDAQGELFRIFTADKVETVNVGEGDARQALPTVTKRTMRNVKTGHRTEVAFASIAYNLGLSDEDFSERRMRRPPQEWTK